MESKDTLGTIAASNSESNDTIFLVIIMIIIVGTLLYILFKPKKIITDTTTSSISSTISTKDNNKIPNTKNEDVKIETSKNIPQPNNPINKAKDSSKQTIETKTELVTPEVKPTIVIPEAEEQSKVKFIGYNPINIFAQTEPLYFPYVMMPKPNCVIKFPRKGRAGRKGFKEEAFKEYVEKYFKSNYQIFDDRFIKIKNSTRPYEPDFALVNEKNGINIFLDIEIDEPYEGTNDIENRKPTHYKYADTKRNYAFTNRGWIVIRFAEIQVHEQPDACCQFVAHILKSIHSEYTIPTSLQTIEKVKPLLQWTEDEAKQSSLEKYRERYLGIERFGVTGNAEVLQGIEETELGEAIEEKVVDEEIQIINPNVVSLDTLQKLFMASVTGKYVSFSINNEKTVFKPTYVYDHETSGFCYVKNDSRTFRVVDIDNVEIKDSYYSHQYYFNETDGINEISSIINNAILQKKTIRIVYTKPGWVDYFTGEITEREESERTLSDIDLSVNLLSEEHIRSYNLDENYITGFCNTKEELRTFKFNRISRIEILDI